jgi:hypothetical protein
VSPLDGVNGARRNLLARIGLSRGAACPAREDAAVAPRRLPFQPITRLSTAVTMTCLMRANVGQIVRTPDGGRLFLELLDELSRISSLADMSHPPSS